MTDTEIAEIAAAWGHGISSAAYTINRLLDELKAARASYETQTNYLNEVLESRKVARAERDAARAQAFEEAAIFVEHAATYDGVTKFVRHCVAELRRRANAPDGSRTARRRRNENASMLDKGMYLDTRTIC